MFQIFPIIIGALIGVIVPNVKISKSAKSEEKDIEIVDKKDKLDYSDCGDTLKKYRLKHGYGLKDRKK